MTVEPLSNNSGGARELRGRSAFKAAPDADAPVRGGENAGYAMPAESNEALRRSRLLIERLRRAVAGR